MQSVGAFQAKTHLSQLLDQVEHGEEIMITRHGEPIAMLVPIKSSKNDQQTQSLIDDIKQIRKGLSLGELSIKELIDEGRKY